MEFKKYNSIENSYQKDFLHSIVQQGFSELEYVVQEKVHGANLSFITNGTKILLAKRTELIADDENFFNSEFILEKYKSRVLELFKLLSQEFPIHTLTIFGELFGGGYPHPEVEKDKDSFLIQKGIYYLPGNEFYAFDIFINGEKYLNVNQSCEWFEKTGFIFAKTLFKGSLKECLAYPNDFKTTLPALFGLPELDGNICEGVIIRPVVSSFLHSGSRVLIKNKNENWSENNKSIDKTLLRKHFHEEGEALSPEATFLSEEIYKLITENRLSNLISKIGTVNHAKDSGKILGMYNKDVLTDFLKTHKEQYENLEKHESKSINKFLNKHAAELIMDYFLK
jgi:Rnl2 family RNA ligase